MSTGTKVGFDPWLHTDESVARYVKAFGAKGIELTALDANPIDKIWHDRPSPPTAPVEPYSLAYSGRSSSEKRDSIVAELKKKRY